MNDVTTQQFVSLRKQYIESQYSNLNAMQLQAVCATEGPVLILAGAGSGKTTVLVSRIANMVRFGRAADSDLVYGTPTPQDVAELTQILQTRAQPSAQLASLLAVQPVRPYNILAITFTNKAAGELKERLQKMLGEQAQDIHASTFHSACVRILRREAEHLGFPKSFTIYDSDDQQRVMKEIYKNLSIDEKFLPIKSCAGTIGRLKDKMISPAEALAAGKDARTGLVAKIYDAYQKRLRSAGAMDFDDLIYYTVKLLQDNEEVRSYYQNKFKYILVDEYQDTSVAQFLLVHMLGSAHRNVCVVGDDDQSIYRFRGATIENILNFESHFPGALTIRLEQNYRSTSNILNAANCVIKNNTGRKGKTLWTDNGDGQKVINYVADDEYDEAARVAQAIGENLKNGAKLRDHAVLYRMNAQSNPIETYFARAGIPYKIVGGRRFYDRKEIKDITAYMSIVANRQDDLRLRRIINEPARKLGATSVDNLAAEARSAGVCMLDVLRNPAQYPSLQRAAGAFQSFYIIYQKLLEAADTLPLDSFVSELVDITGYRKMLEAEGEEGKTRLENIGQLISAVKTYADQKGPEASLSGYLEEVALISDLDSYDQDADTVVMMTMHAAKGLEFPFVFIVGMEDGIFPSEMTKYSEEDLEEERRLCYVGITRAKKELFLIRANSRMLYGQTKRNQASRFLTEISPELMETELSRNAQAAQTRRSEVFHSTAAHTLSFGGGRSALAGGMQPQPAYHSTVQPASRSSLGLGEQQSAVTAAAPSAAKGSVAFKPGDLVEHKVFGRGQVLKVTPVAGDNIVEIRFANVGVKKTMANYAPLTLVQE